MNIVLDEPAAKEGTYAQTDNKCPQDEEEVARRIEKAINEAKAAVSEKFEDGKIAAERLLRQGRHAVEDGISELTHTVKRHPVSFLGIAFAVGIAFGLLLSHAANRGESSSD